MKAFLLFPDSSYETSISFINVQTGQSPAAALNSEFLRNDKSKTAFNSFNVDQLSQLRNRI